MSALDPDVKALLDQMHASDNPPLWELPIGEARNALEQITAELGPRPVPDVETEDVSIRCSDQDLALRVYRSCRAGSGPLVLLLHGGGWALGSISTHDAVARFLCNDASATVVSVEYRLAPEHPFPQGLDDCIAAIEWCAALRQPDQALAVLGDSAGGNLAAVLAQQLRNQNRPWIDAQVLLYPCVDIARDAPYPSRHEFGSGDYFLGQQDLDWLHGMYLADHADPADPRISPIHAASLSGLPPALIITAGFDPLRDEGRLYHERLVAEGVTSTYHCFDGSVHGFISFGGALSSGRDGLRLVSEFLRTIRRRSND